MKMIQKQSRKGNLCNSLHFLVVLPFFLPSFLLCAEMSSWCNNSLRAGRSADRNRWVQNFPSHSDNPWDPPSGSFSGVKGPLTTHLHLASRLKNEYSPSGPSWPVVVWHVTYLFLPCSLLHKHFVYVMILESCFVIHKVLKTYSVVKFLIFDTSLFYIMDAFGMTNQ
jgi:hypothetical protein